MPATTLVHGDDHSFVISAPTGWVLDDTSGMGSLIRVVFYPRGQSWSEASTVMYANPLHHKESARAGLEDMIEKDVKAFRKQTPRGMVSVAPAIETVGKRKAEVRWFAPDGTQPVEACAYIPEDGMVMLLVLSSRSADGFQKALPAFQWLVHSYDFVGKDSELQLQP